jgi:hypothetical protein
VFRRMDPSGNNNIVHHLVFVSNSVEARINAMPKLLRPWLRIAERIEDGGTVFREVSWVPVRIICPDPTSLGS